LTMTIVRVATLHSSWALAGRRFGATWLAPLDEAEAPLLLSTDLPASLPLCQHCGSVDDRDQPCPVCSRFVCTRCLPSIADAYCSKTCQREQQQRQQEQAHRRQLERQEAARQ